MKIVIAKNAGFCMGVRRAVEMALDAPGKHPGPIYTYGPLIHNPQVLDLMREKGISILREIPVHGSGTVLVRAHGVPPPARQQLRDAGFNVIDATCPRVIKVQSIIKRHAQQGYASIIVGDRDHAEVVGLSGYAGNQGQVIDSLKALVDLPLYDKAIIVAQTTQNTHFFEEIKAWTREHAPHYKVFETICDSTERRQSEAKRLAEEVDVLLVVGGRDSGNTRRLAEIGRDSGIPTAHIETELDLDPALLTTTGTVGITAGASTPNWIINRVCRAVETIPYKRAQGWIKALFNVQRTLLVTNVYVSIGAGCLCYACSKLLNIPDYLPYVLISILYVQSMHILNNLTGIKADLYTNPERASFYNQNKALLTLLALLAGGIGLLIASNRGVLPFIILAVLSMMGLSYNLKIIPTWAGGRRYQSLKDIPGSKTILISAAWGFVTAVFPWLSSYGNLTGGTVIAFTIAFLMVFTRTAFFDILDMQGDRIVGRGTLPILIGEQRAMRMVEISIAAISFLLLAASASGLTTSLGYGLIAAPIYLYLLFKVHRRGVMLPGARLEFLVETQFIIAGLVTFLWSIL